MSLTKLRQQEPLHPDNEFESPQRTSSIGCFASSGNLLYSGHLISHIAEHNALLPEPGTSEYGLFPVKFLALHNAAFDTFIT